jgi:hypothetical protein
MNGLHEHSPHASGGAGNDEPHLAHEDLPECLLIVAGL